MSADVLSQVLRAVRLSGAVFFTFEAADRWVAEAPTSSTVAPLVLPGAEHVSEFHVVTRGSCWAGLADGPKLKLAEGDVIMFPQGDAHVMSSAPGMRGDLDLSIFRNAERKRLPLALSLHSGGREPVEFMCGFLGVDARPFNPLLAALPRMLHMPHDPAPERAWVGHLIQLAARESASRSSGGACVLSRVSEILFIEVVRRYLATLPSETTGWLAGLRDDVIGRSLAALHDRPEQPWSIEDLAKHVGVSRSLLAERFHHFVGAPPMQYLARWRMQLAASLLSGTNHSLAEVSQRVGYGSEAALSRAFKRLVGVSPSAWRQGARPSAADIAEREPGDARGDNVDGDGSPELEA